MKQIELNIGFALVDDEDFDFLNRFKWIAHKAGKTTYVLNVQWYNGRSNKIYMHRLIMLEGNPKIYIDHKDFNGLNNQKGNLRKCTKTQNHWNTRAREGCSSKYLGVSRHACGDRWVAQINHNGTTLYLGLHNSEVEAALVYNSKASELRGEFAHLNEIENETN